MSLCVFPHWNTVFYLCRHDRITEIQISKQLLNHAWVVKIASRNHQSKVAVAYPSNCIKGKTIWNEIYYILLISLSHYVIHSHHFTVFSLIGHALWVSHLPTMNFSDVILSRKWFGLPGPGSIVTTKLPRPLTRELLPVSLHKSVNTLSVSQNNSQSFQAGCYQQLWVRGDEMSTGK